ncbi:PaaI family thioesterase [Angustibacter luteus]|uniref:PaaI family thioesterase n=1 Tax=Angustibacter luteus TaxID=658456 RepID=A0ABW1JDZ0_9ACTN
MSSIADSVADQFPDGAFGIVGDTIGFTVDELTGDSMRARWNVVPAVHQPHGILHGGIHAWIHETVASVAATVWFGDQGYVVGVSNQTDFFRAVSDGEMTTTGTPLHRGRSQQVWVVETRDAGDRLIARGQVRLQNMAARGSNA